MERGGRHGNSRWGTYVRNAQRGQVVPLAKLAPHPLPRAGSPPQRGRHVRPLLDTRRRRRRHRRRLVAHPRRDVRGAALAHGGHSILVRAPSRKVLAVTDTALDLLVAQLVLHGLGVGVRLLVLRVLAPVGAGPEDDVLAHRRRVRHGARAVLGAVAELGPRLAVRHPRVHPLRVRRVPHPPGRLDLLVVLVDVVGDDGLGAVLVAERLRGRELRGDLVHVLIVGPVVPSKAASVWGGPGWGDGARGAAGLTSSWW